MPSESPRESAFTTYTNEEVTGPPTYRSPLPEGFAIQYLPYRGSEFHGVDPGKIAPVHDEDVEGGKVPISGFTPGEEDIAPVPVRIVGTAAHEYRKWQAGQVTVNALSAVLVGSFRDGRTSLKIKNLGGAGGTRIWVGPDSNVTSYTGYPVEGDDEISFSGEAPVYAIADTGTITVAVLTEYSISE